MAAGPRGLHPRLRPKPHTSAASSSVWIDFLPNHLTLTAVVNRATQGRPDRRQLDEGRDRGAHSHTARDAEATRVRPTNRPDRYVSPAAAPLRAPERFGLISKSVAGQAL
jgi:hypothetical protein